ncbi:hypothetical protein [Polaromonas sp.]
MPLRNRRGSVAHSEDVGEFDDAQAGQRLQRGRSGGLLVLLAV